MHPLAIVVCLVYTVWTIADTFINNTVGFAVFFLLVTIGIGYICGEYAAKNWAPKIKGSQSFAFTLPFTMNLLGFVCYWCFYKYHLEGKVWYLVGFIILAAIIAVIVLLFLVVLSNPAFASPENATAMTNATNLTTATYALAN